MKQIAKFILPYWKKGLIPVFYLLAATGISMVYPLFPKWAIDEAMGGKDTRRLLILSGAFLALIIMQRLLNYLNAISFFKFQKDSILDIQKRLTRRVFYYPMEFFDKNHSGYLMGRIRGDVAGLSYIFSESLIMIIMDSMKFIVGLSILLSLNVKLTLLSTLLLPFLLIRIMTSRHNVKAINEKILEENSRLEKELSDTLQGMEVLKSFSREEEGIARMEKGLAEFQTIEVTRNRVISGFQNVIDLIVSLGEVLLLYFGIQEVILGRLTIGAYVAFSGYLMYLYSPIRNLSSTTIFFDYAKRSYRRIQELLDILPEDTGHIELTEIHEINAKNLSFAYNQQENIIDNLSFTMRKGDKILIEGESGSGKSTLLKLILGLYRPKEGEILFNGIPYKDIALKKLREKVGYISQSVFLFNKTIKENILFNRTDVSDAELEKLLQKCKLAKRITDFDKGIYEEISEKGVNFSGGEKQRLALARALIKNPEIIIIDEGTSNLDVDTEKEILENIVEEFKDKIIIRITHREADDRGWRCISLKTPRPSEEPGATAE